MPTRRTRSPAQYGHDTDSESEKETPRPKKSHLKKRLSEAHVEAEGSFNSGGSRPPLRSVNINDDIAEKRRRRKSTKLAVIENAIAGPSSGNHDGDAAPADPMRAGASRQRQQLQTVAAPIVNAPLDIIPSNFEEWMKMATDNKINAANSWDFALIDYFHDMSLLRNDDDNSINFQRASCTLDGCVKIWTSRVDSVGTETGKLLSNLESESKNQGDDDDDSDNPDAEGDPTQPKKKKQKTGNATNLAKDASQLKQKKPDLEFAVDPLFRKTCADFDEGGASGLLMNHLSLGIGSEGCMRVIFDGSDPMGKVDDEEIVVEPEEDVDLSFLRREFLPDLSVLEDKAISHSLAGFTFGKHDFSMDDSPLFQDSLQPNDFDDDSVGGGETGFDFNFDSAGGAPAEDFFGGPDAGNDDFGGDAGGDDFGGDNNSNGSVGHADGEPTRPGPYVAFDPRRMPNERDLVLAMADGDGDGGALDYFDQNFMKNWAGPEHWKVRRVARKPEAEANAANKATKTKQKKEVVTIDFLTPSEKSLTELKKELFAPVGKGASINLPGTGPAAGGKRSKKKKEKRDDHKLPDDMHFSSRQLVTLFLKPKFYLRMRGRKARINEDGDGEVDEGFWAQAAADQAAGRNGDDDGDDAGGAPVPFNTQFFHEDDFGPGFDDDGDGGHMNVDDVGEQDLLAGTQGQSRRARPDFVNYAKRAKRVDVRKLKDTIWKNLDIVVDNRVQEDEEMDVDGATKPEPTSPSDARQFTQVISGLQKSYPQDKMDEISTSFCFICLLHLANEQGLKLESSVDMNSEPGLMEGEMEEVAEDKKIGNIWDIKIYRDPNATQSA